MRSGVPAAASVERAHDDALRELDLEGVVAGGPRVGERGFGGAPERRLVRARAVRAASSAARARHGFAATPPSASRASRIVPPSKRQRRRGRDDREGEGRALAKLQIARMARRSPPPPPEGAARRSGRPAQARSPAPACRRADGEGLPARSRAGPPCPRSRRWRRARRAARRSRTDASRCNARSSRARRASRFSPCKRIAAGARLAPVAGARHVIEIAAARPLHEIAADRRGVAKLRRRAGEQRFGDRRIGARERRVVREVGVAHQRADAHAAVGKPLDAVEARKPRDVDERGRAARRRPSSGRARLVPAAR